MAEKSADELSARLAGRFAARLDELRGARREAQARIDGGAFPAFPADAREVRDADWRVAGAAAPAGTPRVIADATSPDAFGDVAEALAEREAYVELPDLRTREEAALWREILQAARDATWTDAAGVCLPVDSIQAAFELEGIVYELRDHVVALAWHRNRYLLSFIRAFHRHPRLLLPDRSELEIGAPFLRAVGKHAQAIGERRGLAVEGFPEPSADSVNPVESEDLLQISKGKITEDGIRENLRILLAWLPARDAGSTTVAIDGDEHDAASADLALAQLRQWTYHATGVLDIGHKVTLDVIEGLIDDDAGEDLTERLLKLIAEVPRIAEISGPGDGTCTMTPSDAALDRKHLENRMQYDHIRVPADGEAITVNRDHSLNVPDHPIVAFIEGDGIGVDVTPVMLDVVNAAVERAYRKRRSVKWMQIYAGEAAARRYGDDQYLPDETLHALRKYVVSIKGPLTTPVGGGIRSLNVSIRQTLDLYACVRPIRYFPGVSTPMKESDLVDMVVFRENTEDIYAGIEYPAGSPEVQKLIKFLQNDLGVKEIRFPSSSGIGIKPVSREGSQRLVRKALQYCVDRDYGSVSLVHKGNIMKFTEGAFRDWGYEVAREEFGATEKDDGPWLAFRNPVTDREIVVKDVIADNFLQQILMRPEDYDVIATLNLNGDYISDALAAQVGGIGIAPGGNIGEGVAVFEATHGTAPGFAGKDRVNPGSLILSAEMMLRYIGWHEAAELIVNGVANTIAAKELTFDLARLREAIRHPKRKSHPHDKEEVKDELEQLIPGATLVGTRGFGEAVIRHMDD